MTYDSSPEELRADIKRRIKKGFGELVTLSWVELEETGETEVVEDDNGEPVEEPVYTRVIHKNRYYIGKMNLGQTGTVIAVLGAMFINGQEMKKETGASTLLSFINAMDRNNLNVLLASILQADEAWVDENYDVSWVVSVIVPFFQYNDFFGLFQQVMTLLEKMGLSQTNMQELLKKS